MASFYLRGISLILTLAFVGSCGGNTFTDQPYSEFVVAVGSETFILRTTDAETARLATDNLNSLNRRFPIGPLLRGNGSFNAPWSWHFDPNAVRMVEAAIEVCDGRPSEVERRTEDYLRSGYCPWSAKVIQVRR